MPSDQLSALRFYKICALLGTLIIIVDIAFSWMRIQTFENNVTNVFESMVTNQMEFDGLQQELVHIDKVLVQSGEVSEGKKTKVDGIDYSTYEIERLRNEQASIRLHMQEKQLDLVGSSSEKKHIMNEVRILFLGSLVFLVLGTLLSAFGYLAWYFKIELFEDRRKKPR
ncbi:MAG: hypothetical protein DIZ80_14990 [endosymbiont of Galathealinum brachiosum]|uniref:Uncharacterized protein n=1 Tax=endosymbiont of Galathealinum brachiosum TaxID=2200906 RepID=A0A370D925_9GAMM|nr:MAG: hypothetical protein DIZ80_14990 [endosymbiont of Galathealinum brachiosum]